MVEVGKVVEMDSMPKLEETVDLGETMQVDAGDLMSTDAVGVGETDEVDAIDSGATDVFGVCETADSLSKSSHSVNIFLLIFSASLPQLDQQADQSTCS